MEKLNKKIHISTGEACYGGFRDHDDVYMAAEEVAYMEMPEGIEEWLEENYKDQYEFDTDYDADGEDVYCYLFVKLSHKAFIHYKLVWGGDGNTN